MKQGSALGGEKDGDLLFNFTRFAENDVEILKNDSGLLEFSLMPLLVNFETHVALLTAIETFYSLQCCTFVFFLCQAFFQILYNR